MPRLLRSNAAISALGPTRRRSTLRGAERQFLTQSLDPHATGVVHVARDHTDVRRAPPELERPTSRAAGVRQEDVTWLLVRQVLRIVSEGQGSYQPGLSPTGG